MYCSYNIRIIQLGLFSVNTACTDNIELLSMLTPNIRLKENLIYIYAFAHQTCTCCVKCVFLLCVLNKICINFMITLIFYPTVYYGNITDLYQ